MSKPVVPTTKIDKEIDIINNAICRHINNIAFSTRGEVSQDMLQNMRHFVEHTILKAIVGKEDVDVTYEKINDAIKRAKTKGELKFLVRFHSLLQISVSHFTPDLESSERLMLKYYEHLVKTKYYLKAKHELDVLSNLNKYPLKLDPTLNEYYVKIAGKIEKQKLHDSDKVFGDRYYIEKKKPFFVDNKIYYEITFETIVSTGKNDRIIAFTHKDIPQYYAVEMLFIDESIEILGKIMPILIISRWNVSIRPCELRNFARIFGININISRSAVEYRGIMRFLTQTGFNLVELIDFPDDEYSSIRQEILPKSESRHFFDALDKCRLICSTKSKGSNITRYLLYNLRNKIILDQYERNGSNHYWSGKVELHLKYKSIPFDQMPFCSSPVGHNPKRAALHECIDSNGREHELLARLIGYNTQNVGQLYTPIKDVAQFGDIDTLANLIKNFKDKLYHTHVFPRSLIIRNDHIFINGHEYDTVEIIDNLISLTKTGLQNYSKAVKSWLDADGHGVNCDEKKAILAKMFDKSKVAVIRGSAGTGKSTLINHLSNFFSEHQKLLLAHTNPAVDNLKRKVKASNCTFNTITKFVKTKNISTDYPILIIDECSTVNNCDMHAVLRKAHFQVLVLVGDVFQIESIEFGNWFSVLDGFIKDSIFELNKPYRCKNKNLLLLWNRVRNMDDAILEVLTKQRFSTTLDSSIFEAVRDNEIILCLNYDGLYGINNINRFLQAANPNKAVTWGIQVYKINDPILFNGTERFAPVIYNNMKGKIVGIKILERQIQFDIELDKILNGMDAEGSDFELLSDVSSVNSVIRFTVDKYESTDEDDGPSTTEVPFQVAYAVSIHKAQGLEYDSVKIIISEEVDDFITHNIFYTAITRARENLKIYWTPEVENKVLSTIKPKNYSRDYSLLKLQVNQNF